MKIGIIGGGNIGTLMAAEFAAKGHEITMYTRRVKDFSNHITVLGRKDDIILEAELSKVTDKIGEAVLNQDFVWITTPAYTFSQVASDILPFVQEGQYIGIVPGSGGAEFAFNEVIKRGSILFGLQRVHSIARLKEYGHSVYMLGRKEQLYIASIPAFHVEKICEIVEKLFDIQCVPLPNYLEVTLVPSNQIIHTVRLYSMFHDYYTGIVYPRNFLFYDEWDDESSRMFLACGEELYNLGNATSINLIGNKLMWQQYKSYPPEAVTKAMRAVPEFKGINSPMKLKDQDDNGSWIPDFMSRYFTADFSYGIKVLIDLAEVFKVPVPNMKKIWKWYLQFAEEKNYFELTASNEEIKKLYNIK